MKERDPVVQWINTSTINKLPNNPPPPPAPQPKKEGEGGWAGESGGGRSSFTLRPRHQFPHHRAARPSLTCHDSATCASSQSGSKHREAGDLLPLRPCQLSPPPPLSVIPRHCQPLTPSRQVQTNSGSDRPRLWLWTASQYSLYV